MWARASKFSSHSAQAKQIVRPIDEMADGRMRNVHSIKKRYANNSAIVGMW